MDGMGQRLFRADFSIRCRTVLKTPSVNNFDDDGPIVLSQSRSQDLLMYLVAVKSLARFVRPKSFILVDDGFTENDRRIINDHLVKVLFIDRRSLKSKFCPVGGTWERLLAIADLSKEGYIIQLDSDIVVCKEPVEVVSAIDSRSSFTLPTKSGRNFVSLERAAAIAAESPGDHVQDDAERALSKIGSLHGTSYIRGCSGFAGFARGSLKREDLEAFSATMESEIGASVWSKWGSEQVASNFFIANSATKMTLPFERYPYFDPHVDLAEACLVHFMGSHRFQSLKYRQMAVRAISNFQKG